MLPCVGLNARHMSANSKIIRLTSENVKRLQAVEITPANNVVVIAGENGQGKSSIIDSIEYALAGASSFPKAPVRKGADKAKIVVELDSLIITRTISQNGNTSLTVTTRDGAKYATPQAILDGLIGKLSFDPLEFSRQKPDVQAETLRKIAGLDFTKQKAKRQAVFDERTVVNRAVKALEAKLANLPPPIAGLPESEVSTSEVLDRQKQAMEFNTENAKTRNTVVFQKDVLSVAETSEASAKTTVDALNRKIEELQRELHEAVIRHSDLVDRKLAARKLLADAEADVAKLEPDKDLTVFAAELSKLEETNRQVRNAQQRKRTMEELKAEQKKADGHTATIETIDAEIATSIQSAKYPIAGLGFSTDGTVMFNDLPFEQASGAEQLRVSVAIGLALNPKLRVLLVRDGSLLDENSRKLLLELAKENDAQVWLEQVGTQGEVAVVIEDGMVKA